MAKKKEVEHGLRTIPPKEVFVQYCNDADVDSRWLMADESMAGAYDQSEAGGSDGLGFVGVYKLVRVVKVTRETKYVETPVK